ncbi:MAG: hypothetical protein IKO41_07825 [Lachnospiraceae bacterium]|nr:hypothetical protein [Lachnospiraceae bacterium]
MGDKTLGIASTLDDGGKLKKYVTGKMELSSFRPRGKFVSPDEMLLSFANDSVGMVSDAFILYAVAWMGVASKEAIQGFLEAKRGMGGDLLISGRESLDRFLMNRIHVLLERGMLCAYKYVTRGNMPVQLYGITDGGFDVMKQRLKTGKFANNHMFFAKPAREIIEWAAATYVGSVLLGGDRVACELRRVFYSTLTGNLFFPFEFKSEGDNGNLFYVAGFNGNWAQYPEIQTKADYDRWLKEQLEAVYSYLTKRAADGTAIACIVVENGESLRLACNAIAGHEGLLTCLDRIVFTGEGMVRAAQESGEGGIRNAFVRMEVNEKKIRILSLDGGASFI